MELAHLFGLLLLSAFYIRGATAITSPGLLGAPVKQALQDLVSGGFISPWLAKPLLLCPVCMSSIWGAVIFWLDKLIALHADWQDLVIWPFFLISVAGTYSWLFSDANAETNTNGHP